MVDVQGHVCFIAGVEEDGAAGLPVAVVQQVALQEGGVASKVVVVHMLPIKVRGAIGRIRQRRRIAEAPNNAIASPAEVLPLGKQRDEAKHGFTMD